MKKHAWLSLFCLIVLNCGSSKATTIETNEFKADKPLTQVQLSNILTVSGDIDYLDGVIANFRAGLDAKSRNELAKEDFLSTRDRFLSALIRFNSGSTVEKRSLFPLPLESLFAALSHTCVQASDCITTIKIDVENTGPRKYRCTLRKIENFLLKVKAPMLATAKLELSPTSPERAGRFISTDVWWKNPPPHDIDVLVGSHEVKLNVKRSNHDHLNYYSYIVDKDFDHQGAHIRFSCGRDDPVIYNQ